MKSRGASLLLGLGLVMAASARLALAQPTTFAAAPRAPAVAPPPSATPRLAVAPRDAAKRSFTDAIACSACHTTTAWRAKGGSGTDAQFDHSTTGFPLTGQHMSTSCVACHDAKRALKRACVSCHDDFHRGRLSRTCDTCHSPAGWKVTRPLEIHRMTRFPLTGMHVLSDCSECHRRASEHRWTGAPIDCFACHEKDYRRPGMRPVHEGAGSSPAFPRDCSLCHKSMAWVPATLAGPLASSAGSALRVAPQGHDLRFPISFGVHRTATCDDCHASQVASRAVRCIGCHAHDPIRIMQQHRQAVGTDGAACMSCHPGGTRR